MDAKAVLISAALLYLAWRISRETLQEAREEAIGAGGATGVLGRLAFGGETAGAEAAPVSPALVGLGKPRNALGVAGRITDPPDGGTVAHALFSGLYHVSALVGNAGSKRVVGDARLFVSEPHLIEDEAVTVAVPNVVLEPGQVQSLAFRVPLSSLLFSVLTGPLEARLEFAGYQLGSSRFTFA